MSRWDRLQRTATLAGGVLERWRGALVGVIGAGVVGGRLAIEAARSGARVWVCDPETAEPANLGTQAVRCGVPKARTVAASCNAIRPDSATATIGDVRHVGVGVLARLDLLVDCTDDHTLAPFLTAVSNGVGSPLLRVAVDGTGELELGRCLASHGGAGHACQLCGWAPEDLQPRGGRTPCPGATAPGRPPTLAGGAIGMATAAVGLLQAQRLLGGREAELVVDREVWLDLSHFGLEAMELQRSPRCISGHESWDLVRLDETAGETSLAELFARARAELAADHVVLELYQHPLFIEALCSCGAREPHIGTAWVAPGPCPSCGGAMSWRREVSFGRLGEEAARAAGALAPSLLSLGLPADGAMVVARAAGRTRRYVLAERSAAPDRLREVAP